MDMDIDEPQGRSTRQKPIDWVPGAKKHQVLIPTDLRMNSIDSKLVGQELAPKGWKKAVKKRLEEEDMFPKNNEDEETANVHVDITALKETAREATGVGKVSNRPWKLPSKRASEIKTNPIMKTSWDKKMAEKAARAAFLEHKRGKLDEHKDKMTAERKRLEQVKAQKEANRIKSQVVQKVSTATAKRMLKDKKKRKTLKTADA